MHNTYNTQYKHVLLPHPHFAIQPEYINVMAKVTPFPTGLVSLVLLLLLLLFITHQSGVGELCRRCVVLNSAQYNSTLKFHFNYCNRLFTPLLLYCCKSLNNSKRITLLGLRFITRNIRFSFVVGEYDFFLLRRLNELNKMHTGFRMSSHYRITLLNLNTPSIV